MLISCISNQEELTHIARYFEGYLGIFHVFVASECFIFLGQLWENLGCFHGDLNILYPVVSLMTKAGVFHGK